MWFSVPCCLLTEESRHLLNFYNLLNGHTVILQVPVHMTDISWAGYRDHLCLFFRTIQLPRLEPFNSRRRVFLCSLYKNISGVVFLIMRLIRFLWRLSQLFVGINAGLITLQSDIQAVQTASPKTTPPPSPTRIDPRGILAIVSNE